MDVKYLSLASEHVIHVMFIITKNIPQAVIVLNIGSVKILRIRTVDTHKYVFAL